MSSEEGKQVQKKEQALEENEISPELSSDNNDKVKDPTSKDFPENLGSEELKKWPSDHAVTEPEEETEKTEEEKLFNSSRDMFQKVSNYLSGELSLTLEDYNLLERLNKMTTAKYADMSVMAQQLYMNMEELNKKCSELKPFLEQIDQIEKSVTNLEHEAHRLDAYSKRLETKFKKLEKR